MKIKVNKNAKKTIPIRDGDLLFLEEILQYDSLEEYCKIKNWCEPRGKDLVEAKLKERIENTYICLTIYLYRITKKYQPMIVDNFEKNFYDFEIANLLMSEKNQFISKIFSDTDLMILWIKSTDIFE